MNSTTNNEETSRPFGFWLKAVDRLMAAEFATAFESFGVTRREWRLLNRIDGSVADTDRPVPAHKLGRLISLGWVTDADGTWTLTAEGRDAKERLGEIVEGIRAKVTDAVPAEDLETTMKTLEQLARAFGWEEGTALPRGGRGHRHGERGFGRGFGERGFGHGGFAGGFGRGERHFGNHDGCGRDHRFAHADENGRREHTHHEHPHHEHPHRGHSRGRAHFARFAQGSYERGFDAGFTRGRDGQ